VKMGVTLVREGKKHTISHCGEIKGKKTEIKRERLRKMVIEGMSKQELD